MKAIITAILAFICGHGHAQVLFSENRPDAGITLKSRPVRVDTVYIVMKEKIVQGIRRQETFACIYERTKLHESLVFQGSATFFIQDRAGKYVQLVEPLAWRLKNVPVYSDSVEDVEREDIGDVLLRH